MAKIPKPAAGLQKRIFLVEDHPVFRDGLAKLLNAEGDFTVCGEAGDAKQGLKSILKLKPDLAVVDLGLPGKSGFELIKEIRSLKTCTCGGGVRRVGLPLSLKSFGKGFGEQPFSKGFSLTHWLYYFL